MKRFVIAALTMVATLALPAAALIAPQSASAQWLDVRVRPPEPRVEVRTEAPAPVWVPGYWRWDGHAHVWEGGRWAVPEGGAGSTWHEPQWEAHNHGWRFHPGRWGHDDNRGGDHGDHGGDHGGGDHGDHGRGH